MKVRRAALNRIGEQTIRLGAPMTTIEEPLVPIWMYHRYAVEGAASMIGGQDFVYAMRGDGRTPMKWESAANQRKALEALAATLKPSELSVPKQMLDLIPPRPPGFGMHRELFPRTTGEGFDPLAPGDDRGRRDDRLRAAARPRGAHGGAARRGSDAAGSRGSDRSVHQGDIRCADGHPVRGRGAPRRGARAGRPRDVAGAGLDRTARCARWRRSGCRGWQRACAPTGAPAEADIAQRTLLAADIKRFLERAYEAAPIVPAAPAPPGAPIGDLGQNWLASPSWCAWDDSAPSRWVYFEPAW